MSSLAEAFRLNTPVTEILLRGTIMFLGISVMMRLTGKRESGVHSLTDLLVVVLVAEAASHGMAGEARGILDSLLLIATILGWSVVLDAVAYRWPALLPLIKSRATPLIVDGKIIQRSLRREFMQREELMSELRLHGITDVREVARAYLEPNGMVSIIRADQKLSDEPSKPPTLG